MDHTPLAVVSRRTLIVAATMAATLGLGAWRVRGEARPATGELDRMLRRAERNPPASPASAAGETRSGEAALGELAAGASLGASGRVYLRVVTADEDVGGTAPGVYPVAGLGRPAAVAVLAPFGAKLGAWVRGYEVGYWPAELRPVTNPAYANPAGFIAVTAETKDLPVSSHFRLGDFVTHDRQPFPKVVVLREALLDKLELVLDDLERHGVPAGHAVILSGFRTPAYNTALGDASGRARESRHQYGDAADIIVDADHDGRMDDLNGDGRVDGADVRVIEAAVNRVERAYPELAGGLGLYEAQGPSGPFAHVDVRGWVARWGRGRTGASFRTDAPLAARATTYGHDIGGRLVVRRPGAGTCSAPPEFIKLCR